LRVRIDLTNFVVVVTGAAGGIGTGIVESFEDAGASVVVHYNTSKPSSMGPKSIGVQLDLTEENSPSSLIDTALAEFGRIDALINNAAVQPHALFTEMTDDQWDEMLAVNLTAAHRLTKSFSACAIGQKTHGSVVNISSIEGTQPAFGHGHYGVSKAGMLMHTKVSAQELGQFGIRVNAVSPGLISRPGIEDAWPEGVGRWLKRAPLGRMGTPRDVGDACVFLCSPLAKWITGANLVVDGGMSAMSTW
jgi:NAD(P)-dependent dehydrogenase (short-subunit alcohol dehydrogenase family)